MLVTNKINLFSFLFGKRYSPDTTKVSNGLKANTLQTKKITDLEGRIGIAKCEDFYKVHSNLVNSPFAQLNR